MSAADRLRRRSRQGSLTSPRASRRHGRVVERAARETGCGSDRQQVLRACGLAAGSAHEVEGPLRQGRCAEAAQISWRGRSRRATGS